MGDSDPDTKSRGDKSALRGGRVLVTHQRPHLDEVVSFWLLTTFDPAFAGARYEFIPYFGTPPSGPNVVTIGIGGGPYDEHKMADRHTSATRLVFDDLKQRRLIPGHGFEEQAIEWLVDYSDEVDRGLHHFNDEAHWPYTFPGLVRAHRERTGSDADAIRFGMELVNNLMKEFNDKAKFLKNWERRVEFESPWGKAAGVESDYYFSEVYAFSHGFDIRVQKHISSPVATIKANPQKPADLKPVFEKLNALEPTSWYLHQAKKMIISNIDPSTGRQPTKLTLQQLINIVKK